MPLPPRRILAVAVAACLRQSRIRSIRPRRCEAISVFSYQIGSRIFMTRLVPSTAIGARVRHQLLDPRQEVGYRARCGVVDRRACDDLRAAGRAAS
jgi:hypothetical protein